MDETIEIKTLKGNPVTVSRFANGINVVATDDAGQQHTMMLQHVGVQDGAYVLITTGGARIPVSQGDAQRVSAMMPSAAVQAPAKKNAAAPFIIAGVALLGVFYLVGTFAGKGSSTTTSTAAEQTDAAAKMDAVMAQAAAQPPATPGIGAAVPGDKTEMTLTKVLLRDKVGIGNQFAETSAADGGVLVVLQYKIRNTSDKPLKSYDIPKLKLVDAAGTEYQEDFGKSAAFATEVDDNLKALSDLNPDIAVTNSSVFEVSKTRFDPATWYAETSDGTKIALQ